MPTLRALTDSAFLGIDWGQHAQLRMWNGGNYRFMGGLTKEEYNGGVEGKSKDIGGSY